MLVNDPCLGVVAGPAVLPSASSLTGPRPATRTEAGSTLAPGVSALSLEQLLARLA